MKTLFVILLVSMSWQLSAQNFELSNTLRSHSSEVTALCLRSEDNLLVSGEESGKIIIWDIESNQVKRVLNKHSAKVTHLEFNHSGDMLLSASYDGTVKVWNVRNGRLVKNFRSPGIGAYANVKGNEPTFAIFGENDKTVYFGGYNAQLTKANIRTGHQEKVFSHDKGGLTCGALSDNKKYIAFGVLQHVYVMNLETKQVILKLSKSETVNDYICEVNFLPNKAQVVAWTYGGKVVFWKDENVASQIQATERQGTSCVSFSESEDLLLTGNDGNKAKLWDVNNRRIVQVLEGHTGAVSSSAFSEDETYIVTGSKDATINIWRKPQTVTPPPIATPTSHTFSPTLEGREINVQKTTVVKSANPVLMVWDSKKVDGDTISLKLNDTWVLQRYGITDAKQPVPIQLRVGDNRIVLHAHNLGRIPPNTAALSIMDGTKETVVYVKSDLDKSGALLIRFEPE